VAVVVVAGEIDVSTVPKLRQTLARAMAPPREEVVVDLAAVEFIDASGVGVLVGAAGEAAREGVKFRLHAPSPSVQRVLDLAQLDGTLEVES
jgi:anti-anti-sigma factor